MNRNLRQEIIQNFRKAKVMLWVGISFSSFVILINIINFKLFNLILITAHILLIILDIHVLTKNKKERLKMIAEEI